ncbi:glycosyltransferase family 2 protein [Rossellomorea arthrocnemi]|uniref:glycosyltransferase family 2 protein n=1 Tax=Rossellomorea arthrocnemi TaxID=2769542 RepID=UPI0019181781|nr:glycosyltransferase [Rossellomorea arthrocnemi]
MNDHIKLSVVVLVYNTEQYLRDCLDSLVNQTLDGIEIIAVNDESPDNSLFILEEYAERYSNLTVVNQKNSGGAVAGNKGVRMAKGKYVTIVDSDDIVPLDAYEKMYSKAEAASADIVIGKANIIIDGLQKEILYKKEREVWKENRDIQNVKEYLDIFYDAFYWNKIFNREFLLKYDCLMPPGMLYADRPMVHKAFLYAKRISIITDLVYLWRKRGEDATHKSISQTNSDIKNFKDRIESYEYQLNYFNDFGDSFIKNEFLKRNLDRLLFPISGVTESDQFKEVYLKEVKAIFSQIDDIHDNDLGVIKNVYIYMILNDLSNELVSFLSEEPKGKIVEEDGKYFWALPLYKNNKTYVPDEIFQLKKMLPQFIAIDSIELKDGYVNVDGLSFPKAFDITGIELLVRSRLNIEDAKSFSFEETDRGYSVSIDLNNFDYTNVYDIYLSVNNNNSVDLFRITSNMLSGKSNSKKIQLNEQYKLFFTKKGNLSLLGKNIIVEALHSDSNQMKFLVNKYPPNRTLEFFVKNRVTKEKVYFKTEDNGFSLLWKHFMETDYVYDLYYEVHGHNFRLSSQQIHEFDAKLVKWPKTSAKLYVTNQDNISIDVKGPSKITLRKIQRKLKKS